MNFWELCNLLLEAVLPSDILKISSDITELEKQYRATDKPTFKNELKQIKKTFISKMIKENHKSIMDRFFPFLKDKTSLGDDAFKQMFFNTPDIWENIEPQQFQEFVQEIENAIEFFASRNHSAFGNLRVLSNRYLMY
jgi:hypothetical protein